MAKVFLSESLESSYWHLPESRDHFNSGYQGSLFGSLGCYEVSN